MCTNLLIEVLHGKADLSTKKTKTSTNARISLSVKDEFRARGYTETRSKGSKEPHWMTSFVFSQQKRLKKEEFPAALKSGKRFSFAHFNVFVPTTARGYAVVVPKKVSLLSSRRHRIKRRVLGALRTLSAVPLLPSFILYPRASVLKMRYDELRAELAELLSPL